MFLRVKPGDPNTEQTITVVDDARVKVTLPSHQKSTEYSFSKVFGPESTQKEVFETVAGGLVTSLIANGKDGLIFSYGVTNSGKTFTVEGTKEQPGLIPQTLEKIFKSENISAYISYLQM